MIKKDILKMKLYKKLDSLIDTYFSGTDALSRFAGSSTKYILRAKSHTVDGILDLFCDESGCIDESALMDHIATNLLGDEGLRINARSLVKNDMLASLLPDRILVISKDDLVDIFETQYAQTGHIT